MRFKYLEFQLASSHSKKKKLIYRPIVSLFLLHQATIIGYQAIIDSGSDYNVFEATIGELLGLQVETGKKKEIVGMGNQTLIGYEHGISMRVAGRVIETTAIFSYQIPPNSFGILGNQGFFNHFRIMFDYEQKYIDVEPYEYSN